MGRDLMMRISRVRPCGAASLLVPLLLVLAGTGLTSGLGRAVPLFSRTYSVPCAQCHEAGARLNTLGMRFLANGYRMPGGLAPQRREVPVSVTANAGYALEDHPAPGAAASQRLDRAIRRDAVDLETAFVLHDRLTFQ